MKNQRQKKILELISKYEIETQDELTQLLVDNGFNATQATVSRDIKELRLLKVLSEHGGYKYATVERAEKGLNDRFIRILTESILSMECVGNLMVIKTLSASANAACEAIDSMKWNEVLGTIAGDNTLLIIGRSPEAIETIQARFNNLIKR
jgi:transcriptional regulator of arginine metabolism